MNNDALERENPPEQPFRNRLYRSQDPDSSGFEPWPQPNVIVETDPGDVIAFDLFCFHASSGGTRRLAWTIEYRPWPGLGDPGALAALRASVAEAADYSHLGFDVARWPAWREWAASWRAAPSSRQAAITRLRLLGILDENRE